MATGTNSKSSLLKQRYFFENLSIGKGVAIEVFKCDTVRHVTINF